MDNRTTIYDDPGHYDAKYETYLDDVPYLYGQVLEFGDPVLEIGCGTGRITIPLARQGVKITGIDACAAMLAECARKAREEGLEVRLHEADCRGFKLRQRFRFIFIPFNTFSHLTKRVDAEACLARAREHLGEDGRLLIDLFNPSLSDLLAEEETIAMYPDPEDGKKVIVRERNKYDDKDQVNRVTWRHVFKSGKPDMVQTLVQRVYFPLELEALLHYNGFKIETRHGDYNGAPFTSGSPKQLIIARVR